MASSSALESACSLRERMGSVALKEQQIFQRDLGYHKVAEKAALLMARDAYGSAVHVVADNASAEHRAERLRETKAAATYVTKVAKAAVTFAYDASGSHGLRNPSRLQRCYRDISVGAAHQVFDERNLNEYCKPAVGLALPPAHNDKTYARYFPPTFWPLLLP